MKKKAKASLMSEKHDKGKPPNEEMRGRIVEKGFPLWPRNDRIRHIQFRAGKMYVVDNMVHADPRKGYVCIEQDPYQTMHFCWMERDALGTKEDDLTPERYDSIFKRVPKCTTGRVYTMKIRSANKNHFYWMQEPEAEKDTELIAKVNYLMNFPPAWLMFPQIVMSASETSYESAESEEQEDTEEVEERRTRDRINEMDLSLNKILRDVLKDRGTRTSEDSHSPKLFCTTQDVANIITPDPVRDLEELSDSEYADAVEGKDSEYWFSGTAPVSGKPGPSNGKQSNRATAIEHSNRDTEVTDETRNDTQITLSARSCPEFLDEKMYRMMSLPCASSTEFNHRTVNSKGPLKKTQEHIHENMDLNVIENVYGKPGPSSGKDPWNATKAVILHSRMTKSTKENGNKPLQYGSEDVLEIGIPTVSNENQMKNRELIRALNRNFDVNEQESRSETLENWESCTSEPDNTQTAIRPQTSGNTIDGKTVIAEKRSTAGCLMSLIEINESTEKWESNDEQNLNRSRSGQTTIVDAGNNAQAEAGITEKSIVTGEKSSMESSNENTSFFNSSEPPRGIVHDNHSQCYAPLWKSSIYSNFDLDHNDQAAMLSTALDETENDDLTANNNQTKYISIKTTAKEEMKPHEPAHKSALDETKGSSHETRDHVIANKETLQIPAVQEPALKTCSRFRDPRVGQAEKKNVQNESSSSTVPAAPPSLGKYQSVKLSSKKNKTQGCQIIHSSRLLFPHESDSMGVSIGTGTTEESSMSTIADDLPGCSNRVPPSLESGPCSTEVVNQSLPSSSKLKNALEQPEFSNVSKPMPFELCGLDTKSRGTALSMFSSFLTFSDSSLSEGSDDSTIKEMSDPPKCGTGAQGTDEDTAENAEIKNETIDNVDDLHENDDTSLDDGLTTNNIAMMALVRPVNSEKPKPTSTRSPRINNSPQSADPVSNSKIHNSRNKNQGKKVTGSAPSQIGGPDGSSGSGLQNQTPAEPDNAIPDNQKVSNRIHGTKNSEGKKNVAPSNMKSLEEITFISGPHKEVMYNLRKRRTRPSLTGPSVAGVNLEREDRSSKRPRVSSPGMPLPLPFSVLDASTARLRNRRVSGSALLQSPNQVERVNGRTLRKRPNDDEADSVLEELPAKKVRPSDGNSSRPSKAGSSRQPEGEGSAPGSKPATRSGGSGSSPGSLSLNKTSAGPITNETPSHDSSQSAETGPRYNLRSRSAKIETEPVKIREIRNAIPETVIRARTVSRLPPGLPLNRTNRDRSQNTRPVIIEDKNSPKSKPNGRKP